MKRTLAPLVGLAILTSCSAVPHTRTYLSPSEALAQQAEIDGKKVTIGGVVDLGTNSRCLYDSEQAVAQRKGDGTRVITLSEGDRLLFRKAEVNRRFVLVTGTFKRVLNEPDVLDLYQCNDAGIEQDTIRVARP